MMGHEDRQRWELLDATRRCSTQLPTEECGTSRGGGSVKLHSCSDVSCRCHGSASTRNTMSVLLSIEWMPSVPGQNQLQRAERVDVVPLRTAPVLGSSLLQTHVPASWSGGRVVLGTAWRNLQAGKAICGDRIRASLCLSLRIEAEPVLLARSLGFAVADSASIR